MAVPEQPVLFSKATTAICGPDDDVVIGEVARSVSREKAMEHVAGYVVVNDVSEREFQLEHGGQWFKGKSCDTFGPTGPWLVTPDEVPNIHGQGELLPHDRDGEINVLHAAQNIRYEIALLETCRVATIDHLVVGRTADVVEDRTGQLALRHAAKVMKVMAIVRMHGE